MITKEDNTLFIQGPLTQDTAEAVLASARRALTANTTMQINLAQVGRCDSSSLAVLLGILRAARKINSECVFVDMPTIMQDLSKVTGLQHILNLSMPY